MSYFAGTATYGTGSKSVNVGFTPAWFRITVGPRVSTTEVSPRTSLGWTDGTNQWCHSTFSDSTGREQIAYSDRIVSQRERVSGTITEVLRANFVSFSGTTVNFDVITSPGTYRFYLEAGT